MRRVKIAAVQMKCEKEREKNIDKAVKMAEKAAENGANIILLPELFESLYFCQEKRYDNYK